MGFCASQATEAVKTEIVTVLDVSHLTEEQCKERLAELGMVVVSDDEAEEDGVGMWGLSTAHYGDGVREDL